MAEKFSLTVDGLKIAGEMRYPPQGKSPHPTLCICHGIPAVKYNPAERGYAELAEHFSAEGFATCIFNFRGAGESQGNLDLLGWTRDLDAVIAHLARLPKVDKSRIYLMGFSGGAATSAYIAAQDKRIAALILCACPAEFAVPSSPQKLGELLQRYREIGTVRDADFPPSIEQWGEHFRQVNPIDRIDRIAPRPLLIVHGDYDETVPSTHARKLYERAKEPKELVIIPGEGHRLRSDEAAMSVVLSWLKKRIYF